MKENINIAVVGLGYVGLPLSIEFAKLYNTIGFDIDQNYQDCAMELMTLLKSVKKN